MSMFVITLTLLNPMTNDREAKTFQFDTTTFTQTKWNSAYPTVQTMLNNLIANTAAKEPTVW